MTDAVEKVGDPAALAAKTATPTIPIAFVISGDPLKARVVAQIPERDMPFRVMMA